MQITQTRLSDIAGPDAQATPAVPFRDMTIWEFTTYVRPMSVGHFRRVLKETPDLPQGRAISDSGAANVARVFDPGEVARLRRYFDTQGRQARPQRSAKAPVVSVMQMARGAGRTQSVVAMATAAALQGLRVLVVDADPAAQTSRLLAGPAGAADAPLGVLPLIARSYGGHLLRANQLRLDQGETPLPMEDAISRALSVQAADAIRPGRVPGLDLVAAPASLALADLKLGQWQGTARSWQPWRALYDLVHRDGVAEDYDLVVCDTGPGVGPLNLAMAASSDVLVLPVQAGDPQAEHQVRASLRALAAGVADVQTRANHTARALGQPGLDLAWQGVHVLVAGDQVQTRARSAQIRAAFGTHVLPDALPEVPDLRAGRIAQFHDLAPKDLPRAAYVPLRDAVEACWQGLHRAIMAPV